MEEHYRKRDCLGDALKIECLHMWGTAEVQPSLGDCNIKMAKTVNVHEDEE